MEYQQVLMHCRRKRRTHPQNPSAGHCEVTLLPVKYLQEENSLYQQNVLSHSSHTQWITPVLAKEDAFPGVNGQRLISVLSV